MPGIEPKPKESFTDVELAFMVALRNLWDECLPENKVCMQGIVDTAFCHLFGLEEWMGRAMYCPALNTWIDDVFTNFEVYGQMTAPEPGGPNEEG